MTSDAVLHTLNWLSALNLFAIWKAVVCKQVNHGDKEFVLRKEKEVSWVLVMVKALLDTILSVAASVILSLLLTSGDIEENPGPGSGGS